MLKIVVVGRLEKYKKFASLGWWVFESFVLCTFNKVAHSGKAGILVIGFAVIMWRAICQYVQFVKCAAQFRNC